MTKPTGHRKGRPPLDPKDVRRQRDVRLSDAEWSEVLKSAAAAGLRAGPYCRRVLTRRIVSPAPSLTDRKAWSDLARVHANLNQIAHKLNSVETIDAKHLAEAVEIIRAATAATAELRAAILTGGRTDDREDD